MQKIVDFVLVDGNLRLCSIPDKCDHDRAAAVSTGIQHVQISVFLRAGQLNRSQTDPELCKHLLRLPQRFFTMRVGEIISRVNDAVKIGAFINEVALSLIVNILIIGFSLAVMFI
ncbi:MAG: hypothetical protein IPP42_01900 [Saprospiraceae bacterium]|nr:hypothetical protein [Saprospiraceae bacterium]